MSCASCTCGWPCHGHGAQLVRNAGVPTAGLVAQQQCCGPLHLPVADVAVLAQSHQGSLTGIATSIGEQPLKGLLNPAAMARLALTEALTNIVWAPVTAIADIRASVNWMHAAKVCFVCVLPSP
jgi:phosphoribosylformylglycinamidine (FGAM) synthase-like enzyme